MRPGEKRRAFLLEELSKISNRPNPADLNGMLVKGEQLGMNSDLLMDELESMDRHHERLLTIGLAPVLQGKPILEVNKDNWLTSHGEDYLYDLQHPEERSGVSLSTFNIENVNNSGNAAFGDNANFSDNHSSTISIDNSITQLLEFKSEMNVTDQKELENLVSELHSIVDSGEPIQKGTLSKFKGFLVKHSKDVLPAVNAIGAQLFLHFAVGI
ncbi:hypothetical protein [Secundilactobacillus kimchicus]|uniref:hypothetical protein n=1 Tax=Secundilactobacillus kimchicus TaxID=528209 RepID=UPI0024A7AA3A|nr:hypothetical protein [Secundilactobacillus kimchicus]